MMPNFKILLFGIFLFLFLFYLKTDVQAEIVINEFSSSTSDDDWVELYNTSSSEGVDISNYSLIDGSTSGNTVAFNCILAPLGFVVAPWSNKLNNAGDIIKLKNVDTVSDCVAYGDGAGNLCPGKSAVEIATFSSGEYGARTVDGSGSWAKIASATKDGPNDGSVKSSSAICSSPTPIPTATPTPSPSPTDEPTPTPTPTKTATPHPTPTPTPTKNPTPQPTNESIENFVLGEETSASTPSPTPTPKTLVESWLTPNKIIPIILIILGLGLLGGAIFSFVRQGRTSYNSQNGNNNENERGDTESSG